LKVTPVPVVKALNFKSEYNFIDVDIEGKHDY
jgi:hypothetical protein